MLSTSAPVAPKASFLAVNSLSRILEDKAPPLHATLMQMQERALNTWLPRLVPDEGSHSGLLHLFNVGRNLEKMIPDSRKDELTAGEIFLLLTAVLFHDIGRTVEGAVRQRALERCRSKPRCGLKVSARGCRKRHWDHYRKSRDIVRQAGFELGFDDSMAMEYCGLLALCHGLHEPPRRAQPLFPHHKRCPLKARAEKRYCNTSVEPLGSVRVPMLAGLLRIADETENHWTRVCHDRWARLLRAQPGSRLKAFRERVEDVEFSHAGACIIMHLPAMPEEAEMAPFVTMTTEIEKVLSAWGGELKPLDIGFDRVFYEVEGKLRRIEGETTPPEAFLQILGRDGKKIQGLAQGLSGLFKSTMFHRKFPWSSLAAEVGRSLDERDMWLLERMEEWSPDALHVDHRRGMVVLGEQALAGLESLVPAKG